MRKKSICNILKNKVIGLVALSGSAILFSSCTAPKMLQQRAYIPDPTLSPSSATTAYDKDLKIPIFPKETVTVTETPVLIPIENTTDLPRIETKPVTYVVKKGDSFWKIGRMYGVGMKELAAYNNMSLKKRLNAGVTLEIPPGGVLIAPKEVTPANINSVGSKKVASKSKKLISGESYTVKPGDSLWLIAKRANTSVKQLAQVNGINKNASLKVGQKLVLPKGSNKVVSGALKSTPVIASTATSISTTGKKPILTKEDNELIAGLINDSKDNSVKSNNQTSKNNSVNLSVGGTSTSFLPHTVKEGDTWTTISDMYGVSVDELKKANPKIASVKNPKIGSVINIPEE